MLKCQREEQKRLELEKEQEFEKYTEDQRRKEKEFQEQRKKEAARVAHIKKKTMDVPKPVAPKKKKIHPPGNLCLSWKTTGKCFYLNEKKGNSNNAKKGGCKFSHPEEWRGGKNPNFDDNEKKEEKEDTDDEEKQTDEEPKGEIDVSLFAVLDEKSKEKKADNEQELNEKEMSNLK